MRVDYKPEGPLKESLRMADLEDGLASGLKMKSSIDISMKEGISVRNGFGKPYETIMK